MSDYQAAAEFWLKVVGVIGALVALTLTWRVHTERATFEMIDRLYSLCQTLENHVLHEWYLAHLFCIGVEEYEIVKRRIQSKVATDPDSCTEFLVKEKFFAIHILLIYEQVYYQWMHSSAFLHRRRRRFLGEILSYFSERLLQNPRLIAILQSDPAGITLHLERGSKEFIDRAVTRLQNSSTVDRDGPFVLPENVA